MNKNMIIYIDDILESMKLIGGYIKNVSYRKFEEDIGIQDKVLRRLEIIGEVAAKLSSEFTKKYSKIPWKQMIGLRNIIIHEYSSINLEEIWRIITVDLLETKKSTEKLRDVLFIQQKIPASG